MTQYRLRRGDVIEELPEGTLLSDACETLRNAPRHPFHNNVLQYLDDQGRWMIAKVQDSEEDEEILEDGTGPISTGADL